MADVKRVGTVDKDTGSARCAMEPLSPGKRPREAAGPASPLRLVPGGNAGRRGEATPRALALVDEEEGGAPRAAAVSPKRPRGRPGVGLPCALCFKPVPPGRGCWRICEQSRDGQGKCAPSVGSGTLQPPAGGLGKQPR